MAGGRPTKLTKELQAEICKLISECATTREAALSLGLAESTVFRWIERGRESRRGKFAEFCAAIDKARADRSMALKKTIREHAPKDWRAAEAVLHLTEPATQKAVRIHLTTEISHAIERLKRAFGDEPATLRRALTAIAGEDGGGGAASDAVPGDANDGGEGGEAVHPSPAEPDAG